jgi:MFS family permease
MHETPVAQPVASIKPQIGGRRLTITLYAAAALLYWAGLYLYVPTLPTYVQSKSSSLALVGIVLSMYGLWQAIIRLPLGIAADWLGRRKPFIIGGLVLVGLGAWIMGTAEGTAGLAVGRAVTGLAAGTWVPLVVIFSSLFPPEEAVRATALLSMIGSLGRVLATSITGSLNQLGGYLLPGLLPGSRRCRAGYPDRAAHPGEVTPNPPTLTGERWTLDHTARRAAPLIARRP